MLEFKTLLQKHRVWILFLGLLASGCSQADKRFRFVPSNESGITFRNDLKETTDFNIFNYMYFYNGAGVGVGDLNGDGLSDIYFTSNQSSNKLYLNKGNLSFQDITEISGVSGLGGWATGVSIADVNGDGRLDIYVSYLGDYLIYQAKNQLFINQGNSSSGFPIFKDRAEECGLDLKGFSTQAAFFDYDLDGDLDMFMLNHSLHQNGTFGNSSLRKSVHPLSGDKLMRNDNGHFINVTIESGVYSSVLGYGLGVAIGDINLDGWPDIYVGNDFHENDYLYINQKNGSFKEILEQAMPHTSKYTMGVDIADFNNDAYPDIVAMDMLPSDPQILKASAAEEPYDVYQFKIKFGYSHQFARNALQLNNHDNTFSDIALFAGVAATDWSWSTLFADFDLDGNKDIYVSNGIVRRSNDLDYINFITADSIQAKINTKITDRALAYIKQMPQIKISNSLFLNKKDSTFEDVTQSWGLNKPSYSNGTAYADFDNDGDLDLIVNNINDEAFLLENRTVAQGEVISTNHFIQVELKSEASNKFAVGSKIFVYQKGNLQMQENFPARGYLSSVDSRITFGIGANTKVDSLIIVWPDGKSQKLNSIPIDQKVVITKETSLKAFNYERFSGSSELYLEKATDVSIPFKHRENDFIEFDRAQLIPHMLSKEGPAVAIGDINHDGLDDIYLGGAKRQASKLFTQTLNGGFAESIQLQFEQDSVYEDVDATFFDADKDGDLDLLVVSGGNEFYGKSEYLSPRLYSNNGSGIFQRSNGFPEIYTVGSCAEPIDWEGDGDLDLFIGARTSIIRYGIKPKSYLLVNDGKGNFTDQTEELAPSLLEFGFIKDAQWIDVTGDSNLELVVASEWNPITIFEKKNGKLIPIDAISTDLKNASGWWNTIEVDDIDQDGDIDLIAGNLGLNSKLKASIEYPVRLYVSDFDKNDQVDLVLTHYMNKTEYPFYTRDEMTKQMPFLKKRYLSYKAYSNASVQDIFGGALDDAIQYSANEFRSGIFRNMGKAKFKFEPFPGGVQISTVNAIQICDIDKNGKNDLLLGGNFYPVNIQMGRYDASYGALLLNKAGSFDVLPSYKSGLSSRGEVRKIKSVKTKDGIYYLFIKNNEPIEIWKPLK